MGNNTRVGLIKLFVAVLALLAIGWASYNYRGSVYTRDTGTTGLVGVIVIIVLLLFENKIDSLKSKIYDLQQALNAYKRKDKDIAKPIIEEHNVKKKDIEKKSKLELKKEIKETRKIHSETVIDTFIKKRPRPLTQEDFIIGKYNWTNDSQYALTDDEILLRYEGDKYKFPAYSCLFGGYWEATEIGVAICQIAEATPISEEEANQIIKKEEKPRHTRPKERDNWIGSG